jgi:hypothetical protein
MTRPRPLIKAANGMQIRSHIIEGRFHNLGRMSISHSPEASARVRINRLPTNEPTGEVDRSQHEE